MTDIVERLRLGEGTSPDHLLLLEAADTIENLRAPEPLKVEDLLQSIMRKDMQIAAAAEELEKLRTLPNQLLDVHAICDARDQFRNWLQNANELLRDAPIHHYGSDYERWKARRDAHLTLAGDA